MAFGDRAVEVRVAVRVLAADLERFPILDGETKEGWRRQERIPGGKTRMVEGVGDPRKDPTPP